jgi:general secretion pathway protein D
VGENFLEEIGLDVDARLWFGERMGWSEWRMDSFEATTPAGSGLPGTWNFGDVQFPAGTDQTIQSGALLGTFGGQLLDTLQANFLIRATQANRNTEQLVAPKVTVLSGESATMQVRRTIRYAVPPNVSAAGLGTSTGVGGIGGGGGVGGGLVGTGGGGSSLSQNMFMIPTGPTLNITPTITPDKKHVLLNITAELQNFLGFDDYTIEAPIPAAVGGTSTVLEYTISLPQTERSRVRTRVSVPDGGTLLLGGTKRTEKTDSEAGVPVLSKIPGIGRLFTNRSTVDDQRILLILVKPTIILQEEADAEAIAAMEGRYE